MKTILNSQQALLNIAIMIRKSNEQPTSKLEKTALSQIKKN